MRLTSMAPWLCALALGATQLATAQTANIEVGKLGKADTVLRGDGKCTSCHDETGANGPKVLSIGKTKHGTYADTRTPTCVSCHGDSAAHLKKPQGAAKRPAPDRIFSRTASADSQNEACTTCHKNGKHLNWSASTHAARGVACANCHSVHNEGHDTVRDKVTQTEKCYSCHKEQRAQMNRPSHHPVPEGKMGCSDCHNVHGSNPKQLVRDSVNDTCNQCHMEKRGPFVHNHQPVTEDCTICHNAHGTNVASLLKARPPFLCQECHSHTSHPGQVAALPNARTTSTQLLGTVGRGCLNCHTNIHGSNSTQNSATAGRFRR